MFKKTFFKLYNYFSKYPLDEFFFINYTIILVNIHLRNKIDE